MNNNNNTDQSYDQTPNTEQHTEYSRNDEASFKYNAYRDDISAEAVVKKKFPSAFFGDNPMPNESPQAYYSRRNAEILLVRDESKRQLRRSANRMGLLLLMYVVISTVLQVCAELIASTLNREFFFETDLGFTVYAAILYLLIYPTTFPIVIGIGDIGEKRTLGSYLRKPLCSPKYICKYLVLGTGTAYAASILINILTKFFTAITNIEVYDPSASECFTSSFDAIVYFIALCVFAPIFEELLFRGTMLAHHLKYGGWHAIIVSSIMFGMFHQNLQQFFYTTVTGIIFALVVVKTGSLVSSMIMHASFNFLAYMQMLSGSFIDNYNELVSGESNIAQGSPLAVVLFTFFSYIPYLIIIAAVIIFIVELKHNPFAYKLPKGDSRLTASEKGYSFFTAPAIIAAIVIIGLTIAFIAFVYPLII